MPRNLDSSTTGIVCLVLNDASTLVGHKRQTVLFLNMMWMEKVKICKIKYTEGL